jgi:hypothetical protein
MNHESDQDILHQITTLVDEEHALLQQSHEGELASEQHERMKELEVKLDQCWDLLRQRRARRHAGQNPDQAAVRDEGTVEHYLQ